MATKTLKILGLLLTYPDQRLIEAADDILHALDVEQWLPEKSLTGIRTLLAHLRTSDLYDAQEDYVLLFDRTPSLSLHLFEHVHGDSRDRGAAMVDLDMVYREAGLHNASDETPDYLPLFLEYLSILPVEKARDDLRGALHVIGVTSERLKRRTSLYANVFDALIAASKQIPDEASLQKSLAIDAGILPDSETLDRIWEEQFAFDHPAGKESACPKAEDMLARMGLVPQTVKMEKRS